MDVVDELGLVHGQVFWRHDEYILATEVVNIFDFVAFWLFVYNFRPNIILNPCFSQKRFLRAFQSLHEIRPKRIRIKWVHLLPADYFHLYIFLCLLWFLRAINTL